MRRRNRVRLLSFVLALGAWHAQADAERVRNKLRTVSVETPAGWTVTRTDEMTIALGAPDRHVVLFVVHGSTPYDPERFIERVRAYPGTRVEAIREVTVAGMRGRELEWSGGVNAYRGTGIVVDVLLPSREPERRNVWIRLTMPKRLGPEKAARYKRDLRRLLESFELHAPRVGTTGG